jgi:hypothetical protein
MYDLVARIGNDPRARCFLGRGVQKSVLVVGLWQIFRHGYSWIYL